MFSVAAQMKWKVYQFEVMSTFLNGYLEKKMSMLRNHKVLLSKATKTSFTK